MSFEAVPCMFRTPGSEGEGQQYIGIIIRPSSSNQPGPSNASAIPTPVVGNKSIVLGNEPKVLVPANVRFRVGQEWPTGIPLPGPTSTVYNITSPKSVGVNEVSSTSSPPDPERPCSSKDGKRVCAADSYTPDSGIQSLPVSPRSRTPPVTTTSSLEDFPSFHDMPRLTPIDQEEPLPADSSQSEPVGPPLTLSAMDASEIAEQILSRYGPEDVKTITSLIKKRVKRKNTETPDRSITPKKQKTEQDEEKRGRKEDNERKRRREEEEKQSREQEEKQREHVEDETSDEDAPTLKRQERVEEEKTEELGERSIEIQKTRIQKEEIDKDQPRSNLSDKRFDLNEYHKAVQKMLEKRLEDMWMNVIDRITHIQIDGKRRRRNSNSQSMYKHIDWQRLLTKMKEKEENPKEQPAEEKKPTKELRKRPPKPEKSEPSKKRNDEDRDKKKKGVAVCGCTKGGCGLDCLNRALRVACVACPLATCSNKQKEEDSSLATTGTRSKRLLRTRTTRRSGQFLCEFVGDTVSVSEMMSRHDRYSAEGRETLCLALSPSQFVDASLRDHLSRCVQHSCQPNASLQAWRVGGGLRLSIVARMDISSNSPITVDMNHFLLHSRQCACGSKGCRGEIRASKSAARLLAGPLEDRHITICRQSRLFLVRNRNAASRPPSQPKIGKDLNSLYTCAMSLVRRVDGSLPRDSILFFHRLKKAVRANDGGCARTLVHDFASSESDATLSHALTAICNKMFLSNEEKEEKKKRGKDRIAVTTDTSYLDTPIGSYSPDDAWPMGKAVDGDDAVRCVCGALEEDGEMLQCDSCHFWLHSDCLPTPPPNKEFVCALCGACDRPSGDVILKTQPAIRLQLCIYYKALVNIRGLQVRLNETVYVRKHNDQHKKLLKRLSKGTRGEKAVEEQLVDDYEEEEEEGEDQPLVDRIHLRVFRVERLFAHNGHRFLFGFYYARPHETFCDGHRYFHRNEVFATPFYDTLPLNAVIGRCAVLDPSVWCLGRPIFPYYKEEDVLFCEYQIDRNQRSFEKIPAKNHYFINTQPYSFSKFDTPKQITRDFTPFVQLAPSSNCEWKPNTSEQVANSLRLYAYSHLTSLVDRLS